MHAFLSLTNGQWHKCMHSCHWPVVNDINACIYVIDQWSMTKWMNLCHWPVVVFVYKRLQFHLGLTPKSAFLSLTSGQWHECTIECDLHSVNCIFVIDQMHWCHWPFYKEVQKSLSHCIRVIDHWVWFTPSDLHLCHWPNALVSLTKCICVIDHWVWSTLSNLHFCHWPDALVSLTVL